MEARHLVLRFLGLEPQPVFRPNPSKLIFLRRAQETLSMFDEEAVSDFPSRDLQVRSISELHPQKESLFALIERSVRTSPKNVRAKLVHLSWLVADADSHEELSHYDQGVKCVLGLRVLN